MPSEAVYATLVILPKLIKNRSRERVPMPTDFDVEIDRLSTESTKFNKYKEHEIIIKEADKFIKITRKYQLSPKYVLR